MEELGAGIYPACSPRTMAVNASGRTMGSNGEIHPERLTLFTVMDAQCEIPASIHAEGRGGKHTALQNLADSRYQIHGKSGLENVSERSC
jgi:hypothetical protein